MDSITRIKEYIGKNFLNGKKLTFLYSMKILISEKTGVNCIK